MVLDKATLYPRMQCLPIWGDDDNRLLNARVATITYNEIYWMKVQSLFVSAAVLQNTGFMQRPRISYKEGGTGPSNLTLPATVWMGRAYSLCIICIAYIMEE